MSNVYNNNTTTNLPVVDHKYHRTTEHVTGPVGKDRLPEVLMGDVKTCGTGYHQHAVPAPAPVISAPIQPAPVARAPVAAEPLETRSTLPVHTQPMGEHTSQAPVSHSSQVPSSTYSDRPLVGATNNYSDRPVGSTFSDRPGDSTFSNQPVGQFSNQPVGQFSNQPVGSQFSNQPVGSQFSDQPVGSQFSDRPRENAFSDQPGDRPIVGFSSSTTTTQPAGAGYSTTTTTHFESLENTFSQPKQNVATSDPYLAPMAPVASQQNVIHPAEVQAHNSVFKEAALEAQDWHRDREDHHRNAESALAAEELEHKKEAEKLEKQEEVHSKEADKHIKQQQYHQQKIEEHAAKLQEHESEADRHREELEQNRYMRSQEQALKENAREHKEEHKDLKEHEGTVLADDDTTDNRGGVMGKIKDAAHKAKAAITGKH